MAICNQACREKGTVALDVAADDADAAVAVAFAVEFFLFLLLLRITKDTIALHFNCKKRCC